MITPAASSRYNLQRVRLLPGPTTQRGTELARLPWLTAARYHS
jgi:hypothetical protein